MKTIMLPIIAVLLAGCAGAHRPERIAVLQNPETKQTVECRVNPWGSLNNKRQVDDCVAAYEKAGYKLVADSSAL